MSQKTNILRALNRGDRLTQIEAYERFGCTRLGARIWDIEHDPALGIRVAREFKKVRKANGGLAEVKVYFLRHHHSRPEARNIAEEPPWPSQDEPLPETHDPREVQGCLLPTHPYA